MMEKRRWPRTACLERCSVQPYADSSLPFTSRVLNFSLSGLRIEMDSPLRCDEHVKIRVLDSAADKMLNGVGQRVGRVRWCSSLPERFSGCYEAGIEMIGGISDRPLR